MTTLPSAASTAGAPPPAAQTPAEAQELTGHLNDVMDALLATVEEETQLVRAGRLREAAGLAQCKDDLTKLYLADVVRLKASKDYLVTNVPDAMRDLERRHDLFRALLQINLTVLATAHAVSEGIIRGVSDALMRKAAPQTYGSCGRQSAPISAAVQPIALSRTS